MPRYSNLRKISNERAREAKFQEFVKKPMIDILKQIAEEIETIQDYENDLDALTDALFVVDQKENKIKRRSNIQWYLRYSHLFQLQ